MGVYFWVDKQETVQTFDFQNDWALNWTGYNIGYWTPAIETNQWWYIWTSGSYQWWILPPSSVYQWTLKKVVMDFYKPWTTTSSVWWAVGISNTDESTVIEYWRNYSWNQWWLNVWWNWIQVADLTWECSMEIIFEDNGDVTVKLSDTSNTYTYNCWNYASIYQTLWDSNTLWLQIARWSTSTKNYIRSVEITTL